MGSMGYLWDSTDAIFERMSSKAWWGKSCIIHYAFDKGFKQENRESLGRGLPRNPYNTLARRFERDHEPHTLGQPPRQGHLDWISVQGFVLELEALGQPACDIAAAVKDCLPRDGTSPKYREIMQVYWKFKGNQASVTNEEREKGRTHREIQPTLSSSQRPQNMPVNLPDRKNFHKPKTLAMDRTSTTNGFSPRPAVAKTYKRLDNTRSGCYAQESMLLSKTLDDDSIEEFELVFEKLNQTQNSATSFPISDASEVAWTFQSLNPEMGTDDNPSHGNPQASSDLTWYSIGGVSYYTTKKEVEDDMISRFQDLNLSKADINMSLTENETKLRVELPIHKF